MLSFMCESVTRLRPIMVEDERHNLVEGEPSALVIAGCSLQPGVSEEVTSMRDTASIIWTLYAPYSADIRHTDTVIYEGVKYAVEGEPERWKSPTGAISHTKIHLKAWEG